MERKITIYGNYFYDLYNEQDTKTKRKIDYVIDMVQNIERVPIKFFKYLEDTNGLYEIRIKEFNKNIRIFCFFDKEQLVILLNCFIKKTQKIPRKELELAKKLKQQYLKKKQK